MKLISLKLENITSLKGQHIIPFTDIAYHTDLFAITGPTGSGKSSLLIAIGLALFGRTVKNNLSAQDYVTMGASFGHIELTFSLGQEHYVALWNCQVRKKNGDLRAQPKIIRTLTHAKTGEVCDIKDLIDLDFNQFNKVAILNQGKFADFLHASFTERKDLLETILNDNTIALLTKNLKDNISSLQTTIDQLGARSEQTRILDEEAQKQLQSELEQDQEKMNTEKELLELYGPLLHIIEQTSTNTTKLESVHKKLTEYQQKVSEADSVYQELLSIEHLKQKELKEQNDQLKHEKPRLERAIALLEQKNKYGTERQHLSSYHQKELERQEQEQRDNALKERRHKELTVQMDKLSPFIKKNNGEKRQYVLENIRRYLKEVGHLEHQKQLYQTQVHNDKQLVLQLSADKKNLQEQRPDFLDENQDVCALMTREEIVLKRIKEDHIKKIALQSSFTKNNKEHDEIKQTLHDLQQEKKQYETKLPLVEKELERLEHKQQQHEHTVHRLFLLNSIEEHQSTSCPLCEQELHETVRVHLNDQRTKLAKEEKEILSDQINLQREKKQHLKQQIDFINLKLSDGHKRLVSITKELQRAQEEYSAFGNIEEELKTCEERLKSLRVYNTSRTHILKNIEYREQQRHDLKKERELLEQEIALKTAELKTTLKDIKGHLNDLLNEDIDLTSLLSRLAKEHDSAVKYEKEIDLLFSALSKGKESAVKLAQSLLEQQKNIKELQDHCADIDEKYKKEQYPKDPKALIKKLEEQKQELEKQHTQLVHRRRDQELAQQKVQSILRNYQEQEEELSKLHLHYQGQLKSSLDKVSRRHELSDLISNFEKFKQWCQQELSARLTSLPSLSLLLQDILKPKEQELHESIRELQKKITIATTRLTEAQKQQEQINDLLKQIKSHQKELSLFVNLDAYIGKDQFRDYALGVLEKSLLSMANEEIQQLAQGRYKIIHAQVGKRSEFLIEDEWQGRQKRKVSTLSGGETFMLSLGLSLALSNLNRGDQEIGFFLIDEGFGTLDQESIDEVLECLLNLRSRGMQIGIISHVQTLTSRIPVTVELNKSHLGESTIAIPALGRL